MSPDRVHKPAFEQSQLRLGLSTFLLTLITGVISLALSHRLPYFSPIWWSNGVLLAAVLSARRRQWPMLLLAGGAAIYAAHALMRGPEAPFLLVAACNLLEVWLAAYILRHWIRTAFDLTAASQLWRFVVVAVLFAPLLAALPASWIRLVFYHVPIGAALFRWYLADALGIATATPVALAFYRGYFLDLYRNKQTDRTLALLVALGAVTTGCMLPGSAAFAFLIFPALLVVVVQLGAVGGSMGVCLIALVATACSASGAGPFAVVPGEPVGAQTLYLQLFLVSLSLSSAIVSTIFAERRKLLQLTTENEQRFRSLAENSPDVLVLTDLSGRRLYVSSAVKPVLGWTPRELIGKSFQTDVVHPEDIPALKEAYEEVRRYDSDITLSYRCQHKNGHYIWVEGKISLHRDSKSRDPIGFVNVVRDISSRKAAEERLQTAYQELETLAANDSLTGIANRRQFDSMLSAEWKRSMRTGHPLGLLLIDVDFFKNFNDLYGHLRGDDCLRDLAQWVAKQVHRPGDLVARFGGEEFAVILPDTDEKGSAELADKIRQGIAERKLPHAGNSHAVVTVSIGCASLTPTRGSVEQDLIEAADKALYRAKNIGRNAVVRASAIRQAAPRPDVIA
jgi:diguanylate cyclase (GGDEF)-like protein/PAS domain S-box-containing protein